jgi:hypothetical protein
VTSNFPQDVIFADLLLQIECGVKELFLTFGVKELFLTFDWRPIVLIILH